MLDDIISRARRRFVLNLAVLHCSTSGLIITGGLTILLLAGTRWLEWWALLIIAVLAVAHAGYRLMRSMPSRYSTAVQLDQRAHLCDSLSTAFHFAGLKGSFAEGQRYQAEEKSRTVDVKQAIPLEFPRALYAVLGMLLLTASLAALRYGITHRLDLRAPITEVLFEDQAARRPNDRQAQERETSRRKKLEDAEALLAKMGIPLSPDQAQQPDALDKAIDQALNAPAPAGEKNLKGDAGDKTGNGKAGDPLDQPANGDPMDDKTAGKPPGDENKESGGDKGSPKAGGNNDSTSLMSKLKDAVSNMFSKASQNKNDNAQKSSQQQSGSGKAEKSKSDKGSGKNQEQGQDSSDTQEGEPDGQAQDGQQAQAKSASKNSQQAGQTGSGVGSQDGAKDLHAAEQLRAMGKISEILGKRAATVSGETTIEVQSGNQKLTTAYSRKASAHGEADGDVSRDEIPVTLQPYVREYFEQVRKTVPAKAKPAQ